MPTYYALLLLNQILTGLVVGDEVELYSAWALVLLFVASLVSMSGILLLVMKQSQIDVFTGSKKEVGTEEVSLIE